MQIGTAQLYSFTSKRMAALSAEVAQANAEVATGKKALTPSQDPVAAGRLAGLARTTADEAQYAGNLDLAATLLQQGDDALDAMTTQVQRVKELALRAANSTLSTADLSSIATELDGILDAMLSIANTVDARGVPVFAGADGAVPYSRDPDGTVVFAGAGDPPPIPVSGVASVAATDSGARVFSVRTGDGVTDLFAVVGALAAAIRTPDAEERQAAVQTSLEEVGAAEAGVNAARSSLGARAARVAMESAQLETLATSREAERSGLEDADPAESILKLQRAMTVLQASQASFAKLSQLSLFNYIS